MDNANLLSIIIPVSISETRHNDVLQQLSPFTSHSEILVVSEDPLEDLPMGVQWVQTTGETRAKAMNDGAQQATRPYILFLHADTAISSIAITRLLNILSKISKSDHKNHLYYFSPLRFLDDGPLFCALNMAVSNEMARLAGYPSGRHGYCISAKLFDDCGGFAARLKHHEDIDFVTHCKARDITPMPIPSPIYTSKRRYAMYGWFYTTLIQTWKRTVFLTKSLIFGPVSR